MEKRGFVTMATGDEKFYKMALTLLRSYRATSANPLPFGLICDRENKYTKEFDDIFIIDNPTGTYMDKLRLLKIDAYEETLFIDADCIAYGDLNHYWDYYTNATDLSCFGFAHPCDSGKGYFWPDTIGEYVNRISYIPGFHGVCYYIRRSQLCDQMYETCLEIRDRYQEFRFRYFREPADEPILALAMALHGCRPVEENGECFVFYPVDCKTLTYDFSTRLCEHGEGEKKRSILLVHFGSSHANVPLYTIEARKVHFYHRKHRSWNGFEKWWGVTMCRINFLTFRLKRKLKNKMKKSK